MASVSKAVVLCEYQSLLVVLSNLYSSMSWTLPLRWCLGWLGCVSSTLVLIGQMARLPCCRPEFIMRYLLFFIRVVSLLWVSYRICTFRVSHSRLSVHQIVQLMSCLCLLLCGKLLGNSMHKCSLHVSPLYRMWLSWDLIVRNAAGQTNC